MPNAIGSPGRSCSLRRQKAAAGATRRGAILGIQKKAPKGLGRALTQKLEMKDTGVDHIDPFFPGKASGKRPLKRAEPLKTETACETAFGVEGFRWRKADRIGDERPRRGPGRCCPEQVWNSAWSTQGVSPVSWNTNLNTRNLRDG